MTYNQKKHDQEKRRHPMLSQAAKFEIKKFAFLHPEVECNDETGA